MGDSLSSPFVPGCFLQLLYPVIMVVMVTRTFLVKVRPDDSVVFRPYADDDGGVHGDTRNSQRSLLASTRNFGANVRTSLNENDSMFAWADKGQWESVETADNKHKRERDWFRIGFEPIFVDFTKNGSWFVVYSLLEVSCYVLPALRYTPSVPSPSLTHCMRVTKLF